MNELLELHLKNNCYIEVVKLPNGCRVKYPANFLTNPKIPPQTIDYLCREDELVVLFDNKDELVYPVLDYARKPLIMSDIFLKTSFRKMSVKLILLFDNLVRVNKFSDILKGPTNESSIKKEKLIIESFSDILLGCFNPKDETDIFEGVNQIISVVDRGGF